MKADILELREQGLSYNQIVDKLGCSKSTVSYHCGEGQKDKTRGRLKEYRKTEYSKIQRKLYAFIERKSLDFRRRKGSRYGEITSRFTISQLIDKIGNATCYLTGRSIDLSDTTSYHFDHIVPASKGGSNELDNLGVACREANIVKADLSLEELFTICEDILTHNGYIVTKKD